VRLQEALGAQRRIRRISATGSDRTHAFTFPFEYTVRPVARMLRAKRQCLRVVGIAQRALDALNWQGATSARDVAAAANLGPQEGAKALALLARRGLAERAGEGWLLVRRADLA